MWNRKKKSMQCKNTQKKNKRWYRIHDDGHNYHKKQKKGWAIG